MKKLIFFAVLIFFNFINCSELSVITSDNQSIPISQLKNLINKSEVLNSLYSGSKIENSNININFTKNIILELNNLLDQKENLSNDEFDKVLDTLSPEKLGELFVASDNLDIKELITKLAKKITSKEDTFTKFIENFPQFLNQLKDHAGDSFKKKLPEKINNITNTFSPNIKFSSDGKYILVSDNIKDIVYLHEEKAQEYKVEKYMELKKNEKSSLACTSGFFFISDYEIAYISIQAQKLKIINLNNKIQTEIDLNPNLYLSNIEFDKKTKSFIAIQGSTAPHTLVKINLNGNVEKISSPSPISEISINDYFINKEGNLILIKTYSTHENYYLANLDLEHNQITNVQETTFNIWHSKTPTFSPDNNYFYFIDTNQNIIIKSDLNGNIIDTISNHVEFKSISSLSPSGEIMLVFASLNNKFSLYLINLINKHIKILADNSYYAKFTPDGKFIIFYKVINLRADQYFTEASSDAKQYYLISLNFNLENAIQNALPNLSNEASQELLSSLLHEQSDYEEILGSENFREIIKQLQSKSNSNEVNKNESSVEKIINDCLAQT